jgi:hypothetical protein
VTLSSSARSSTRGGQPSKIDFSTIISVAEISTHAHALVYGKTNPLQSCQNEICMNKPDRVDIYSDTYLTYFAK